VGGTATDRGLVVREMQPSEAHVRIDYFHDSSDAHLRTLGVDRALLLSREAWRSAYEEDAGARSISGPTTR
jgi:hypothetical protein